MRAAVPFADRLAQAVAEKGTPLVVGLDPAYADLPEEVRRRAEARWGPGRRAAAAAVREFSLAVLEAVADLVPAVKPQVAYFEQHGAPGWAALAATVRAARRRGLLVLLDAKRGDIGSTAAAYAAACLSRAGLDADAVTVNPLFGWDGLAPFLAFAPAGKGVFALVRTSNPGGRAVQDFGRGEGDGPKFSDHLAALVREWGRPFRGESGYSSLGAVVAGTDAEEAARLRALLPETFFLVPGYGAQGGGAADVRPCFDRHGGGAVVNSARGIIFAYRREGWRERFGEERYAEAARLATLAAREELARVVAERKHYA